MKSIWLAVCVFIGVASLFLSRASSDEPGKSPTPAADPMIGKAPGEVRDDNGLKMKLVWCPPGVFMMENTEVVAKPAAKQEDKPNNDDDDVDPKAEPRPEPRKARQTSPVKVFVSHYWLGKYEVTQSEWKQVMKTEPWKGREFTKEGAEFPATYVSWDEAIDFCRKLTEQERRDGRLLEGWEYTLPTEAQWERACRAKSETKFSFGDDESKLGEHAWFGGNVGEPHPRRVGELKANSWDLHDMHGNVWEWCRDVYQQTLPGGRDPFVEMGRTNRVNRGGGWNAPAPYCCSGFRFSLAEGNRTGFLGFRVALGAVRKVNRAKPGP